MGGLAAIGLGACAPSAGGDDDGDDADTASSEENADNGAAMSDDLTFTSWSLNEDTVKTSLGAIIKDWGTDAGVNVSTPSYPYNDYLKQLLLQVQGSQAIGLAQTDISWLATLAATGKLVDLGESAAGIDFTDTALAAAQVDGVQYGLPWTIAAIGMVYNADLLADAGITEVPATIADFEQALEAVKDLGVIPYAAMTDLAQVKDIIPWMWQFGSPVYDGAELTLGDDGSVAAVQWYQDLLDRDLIALDVDRFDARAQYGQASVCFYEDAIGAPNAVAGDAADQSVVDAITPMARPVVNAGDEPAALAWGHALVVIDGDGSQQAIELAEHLTGDPEITVQLFEQSSVVPATRAALASDAVTGNEWVTAFSERITSGARPNPFWIFPGYAQMEERLGHHVQRVLLGEASAQDAMNDAKSDIEDLMS
jgi:multiple sugar transport system substrate-binding protein